MIEKNKGLTGLKGLRGLSDLSAEEQKSWRNRYAKQLQGQPEQFANVLYRNDQYIKTFGEAAFDANPDYWSREKQMEDYIVNREFDKRFKPVMNNEGFLDYNTGMGADYDKYASMPTKYKRQLLESNFESNGELATEAKKITEEAKNNYKKTDFWSVLSQVNSSIVPGRDNIADLMDSLLKDIKNKEKVSSNILKGIYNSYLHERESEIANTYKPAILSALSEKSDAEIDALMDAETSFAEGRIGNNTFNSYKGEDELKGFDKVDYLARKYAMEQAGMNPMDIAEILENDTRDYIANKQGFGTKLALGAKDIGINTLTYAAQKTVVPVAQLASLTRDGIDYITGTQQSMVWSDAETGEIISPDDVIPSDNGYINKNTGRLVTQQPISHTEAFWNGVTTDGRDLEGFRGLWGLGNQKYLTDAAAFNTLSKDEIDKAKANGGVSKYKIAYGTGESEGLVMGTARMLSFGIVDITDTFLSTMMMGGPKALQASGKVAQAVGTAARAARTATSSASMLQKTGRTLGKALYATAPYRGALGIAEAYGKGTYDEAFSTNMENLTEANKALAQKQSREWVEQNPETYDYEVSAEFNKLKREDERRVKLNSWEGIQTFPKSDELLYQQATNNIISRLTEYHYNNILKSEEHADNIEKARDNANYSAMSSTISEFAKYAIVNKGFRSYLYKTPADQIARFTEKVKDKVKVLNGKELALEAWNKRSEILRAAGTQWWGGAWTNYTDEMQSDLSVGAFSSDYTNYLLNQANGQAYNEFHGLNQWVESNMLQGAMDCMKEGLFSDSSIHAALTGGFGSIFNFNPLAALNMAGVAKDYVAYRKEATKRYNNGNIDKATYDRMLQMNPNRKALWDSSVSTAENMSKYLSNGVLNDYAARKAAHRNLGVQIENVNRYISEMDDIEDVKKVLFDSLPAGDLGVKDRQFIKAINILNALIKKNAWNPEKAEEFGLLNMLSDYNNLMSLVDEYTNTGEINEEMQNKLLTEYYTSNPDIARTPENDEIALNQIKGNLKELNRVSEAINEAHNELDKYERATGETLDDDVRKNLVYYKAFRTNIQRRADSIAKELGTSEEEDSFDNAFLTSFGDNQGSLQTHLETLDEYWNLLSEQISEQEDKVAKVKSDIQKAQGSLQDTSELETRLQNEELYLDHLTNSRYQVRVMSNKVKDAIQNNTSESGESKELNVTDILGEVNTSDNRSLAKAAEKIKQLPWATRVRLIRNIEKDTSVRSNPNGDNTRLLFNDKNYGILKSVYDYLTLHEPDVIDKIKDEDILRRRLRSIDEQITLGMKNPKVALQRMQDKNIAEINHAENLWVKNLANSIIEHIGKELQRIHFNSIKNPNRSKKFAKLYSELFNECTNLNPQAIRKALSTVKDESVKSILTNVKDFQEVIGDIISSIREIKPDIKAEDLQNIVDTIYNNMDSSFPNRNDVIYALQKLANSNADFGVDLNLVHDKLKELDELRNSTVILDAETYNKSRKVKAARKKFLKEQQEKVAKQAEEKEQKRREQEQKKQEELQGRPKEEEIKPGPQNGKPIQTVAFDESKAGDAEHRAGEGEDVNLYNDPVKNAITPPNADKEADKINQETHKDGQPDKVQAATQANTIQELDNTPTSVGASLVGHFLQEYHGTSLSTHKYAIKQTTDQSRISYYVYKFLDSIGVKLSNIVDHELGRILKKNPDTPIHFMKIKLNGDESRDRVSNEVVFNVIEVTDDVRKIHNKSNGNFIKAQDGKEYLIVGTLGGQNRDTASITEFANIHSDLKARMNQVNMGDTDYYVDSKYTTTVSKMYAGDTVKRLPHESDTQLRSILDLINSPERNPYGLSLEDLKFGIVTEKGVKYVNPGMANTFLSIKNAKANMGNAFLYVQSSNGTYIPVRLRPVTINELPENSPLRKKLTELFTKLSSKNWEDRKEAASELDKLVYYNIDEVTRRNVNSKQGKMLWIGGKDSNLIEFKDGDTLYAPFNLDDPNFNLAEFIQTAFNHAPRVQLSISILSNPTTLQSYAESGCLNTDIASLATYGANYRIGSMNTQGSSFSPSGQSAPSVSKVSYLNGRVYRFINGRWCDEHDVPINKEDSKLMFQIETNYQIKARNLEPAKESQDYEYFVLDDNLDNPKVVARNKNTYENTLATHAQAIQMLKELQEAKEREARLQAALQAAQDVTLDDTPIVNATEEHPITEDSPKTPEGDKNNPPVPPKTGEGKYSFSDIWRHDSYSGELYDMFDGGKFDGLVPSMDYKDIMEFLEKKGMITQGIEDIDAWMQNLRDCK